LPKRDPFTSATIRNFGADVKPKDFELFERLGQGSFGAVWLGQHIKTKRICAIKAISTEGADMESTMAEISFMRELYSPYIIQYYGSISNGPELWILMEYCSGGSTRDLMKALKEPISEPEIASIMKNVFRGLEYLHSMHKIHRDIKAGNIMLDACGDAKLGDFGISSDFNSMDKHNTVIGTPYWMAPEVILSEGYDERADIWSSGITMIELAEMKPPLHTLHPMRAIFKIPMEPSPTFKEPQKYSPLFNDFLAKCLEKDPEVRLTATQALNEPFITSANGTQLIKERINKAASVIADLGRTAVCIMSDDELDPDDDPDDDEMEKMIQEQENIKEKRKKEKERKRERIGVLIHCCWRSHVSIKGSIQAGHSFRLLLRSRLTTLRSTRLLLS